MFHTLDLNTLTDMKHLYLSMFRDRGEQFMERHKWPLTRDNYGLEMDQYDDGNSVYCVVEENGHHLASLRVRPAGAGSMVEDHFPALRNAEGVAERLEGSAEITRFCAAPGLPADARLNAVSDLLLGLCRYCQQQGIDRIYGVVFPPVARVIRNAGWDSEILVQSRDERGRLCLAEWQVSGLVAWNIQERREYREEILHRHQQRQSAPDKVALETTELASTAQAA